MHLKKKDGKDLGCGCVPGAEAPVYCRSPLRSSAQLPCNIGSRWKNVWFPVVQ
jgi:hypothetical protein